MGRGTILRLSKRYLDGEIEKVNQSALKEFQGFVMLQQVRFTYKNLKRFLLENNTKVIKHWDLNSSLFSLPSPEKYALQAKDLQLSSVSDPIVNSEDKLILDELLRQLVYDKMEAETIVNMLFASGKKRLPGLLQDMKMSKKRVLESLKSYLNETMQTYQESMTESGHFMKATKIIISRRGHF